MFSLSGIMFFLYHFTDVKAIFSGVRPLLNNTKAHDSIAIGAIHLLSNLHDRLEVNLALYFLSITTQVP